MYRYQFHLQMQMGHWRDFKALVDELNAALQAKGLVPFQLWQTPFGRLNDTLMVAEYGSLEAYEREYFALHTDTACRDLWRQIGQHMDGAPWTDLWCTPSEPSRLTRPPGRNVSGRHASHVVRRLATRFPHAVVIHASRLDRCIDPRWRLRIPSRLWFEWLDGQPVGGAITVGFAV